MNSLETAWSCSLKRSVKASYARPDDKMTNLWWRPRKDGIEVAYFRKLIAGKDTWKAIGVVSPAVARAAVQRELEERGRESLYRKLGIGQEEQRMSTVGELLTAYRLFWAGTTKDPDTANNNALRFLQVIREGAGGDEAASVKLWSRDTIKAFETARIKEVRAKVKAQGWDAEEAERRMTSAMRTVWGVFRQARSVFSREALESAAYRPLTLPARDELRAAHETKVGDASMPSYTRPAVSIVSTVVEGLAELARGDRAMFLAAMMEILVGARVGTAAAAKWAWFLDQGAVDITTGRHLVAVEIRLAKGGLSTVQIFREDYEALLAVRGDDAGEYVVPGADEGARREVFERLADWLRGKGLDRRQPNHELRKLFADTVAKSHGRAAATDALGHSSPQLLRHYAEAGTAAPISLADVLKPVRRAS